uniref:Uncharacterized protein n=1 Tax=Sphingobacterium sp. (strain 21) TaxID=743722 RepID=F4C9I1_SPHS2
MRSKLTILLTLTLGMAYGQSPFIGSYNGSQREAALELYILPQHHFVFAMSYGAIDRTIVGKWEQKGEKIFFQETKSADRDAFIVYEGVDKELLAESEFVFKNFSQNTGTAFRILPEFHPDSMKLIHLRDENTFSMTNRLSVTPKAHSSFFLSAPNNSVENDVYEFKPATTSNTLYLYYNHETNYDTFQMEAYLKGDSLYMNDGAGERFFAVKGTLNSDYEALLSDATENQRIPLQLEVEGLNGKRIILQRLRPVKQFKCLLHLDENSAYFSDHENGAAPTSPPILH